MRNLFRKLLIFFLTLFGSYVIRAQTITTYAGGSVGDNGPAVNALIYPNRIAVDQSGATYIAEVNTIRKIDANGTISTIAGRSWDYTQSGDGGLASDASFYFIQDLEVDNSGNLYILSAGLIRKIDASTNVIQTIAGGGTSTQDGQLATNSFFYYVSHIAIANNGDIYLAETPYHRIRKIDATTNIVTTVAGTLGVSGFSGDNNQAITAKLNAPHALEFDNLGNLYISDGMNFRVRKVNNSGVITTVAGTGVLAYSGDGGLAINAALGAIVDLAIDNQDNVVLIDISNNRVRKINSQNGIISTIAGNGTIGYNGDGGYAVNASFDMVHSIDVDPNGKIHIGDLNNKRIRSISTNGIITTLAGLGSIMDNVPATQGSLREPSRIYRTANGDMYIADTENNRIRKVDMVSGIVSTIAGNGVNGFNGDNGSAINASLSKPEGVAVDSNGVIYIADTGNNRVRKVQNGLITTFAGNGISGYSGDNMVATNASLNSPSDVDINSQGEVLIVDKNNHRIRKISYLALQGYIITTIAGSSPSFYGDGGPAVNAAFNQPSGVCLDLNGNLYIADTGNNRIRKITSGGIISTIAGKNGSYFMGDEGLAIHAYLSNPTDVKVDNSNNIYIADAGNNRVRKISGYSGIITTIAGNGSYGYTSDGGQATDARFTRINGIDTDMIGTLFISEKGVGKIRQVQPTPEIIITNQAQSYNSNPINLTVTTIPAGLSFGILYNGSSNPPVNAGQYSAVISINDAIYGGKASATLYISKACCLLARADNKVKPYGSINPILTLSYSGFLGTDNAAVIDVHPIASTPATQTSQPGTYPITLTGGSDNNYNITNMNGSSDLTVNKATLTVTSNASKIYGDPNPNLTLSYTGFVNGENSSVIDSQPSASTSASLSSDVGTYPIALSGGSDNNYTINRINGTLTVNKAPLSVTPVNANRLYGAANTVFSLSYTGFKLGQTATVIDVAPTISTTAIPTSNVGTYTLTPSGGSDNNYAFNYVNGTLTVNKAPLNVTTANASRTYGAPNPTFAINYSGFVNGETASVIDSAPVRSTTATSTSSTGTYPITLSGGTDNNYTFTYGAPATLTVTKAQLTATSTATKVYGATNPAFPISYTGFLNGETASVIDTQPTATSATTALSNVGSYPITLTGGSDNNYAITNQAGTLTVTKKDLTASAISTSKYVGQPNPPFTINYTGFVNGENSTVLDVKPVATTTATTGSPIGSYPINVSGGSDNNYSYTYVNGVLSVLAVPTCSFYISQSGNLCTDGRVQLRVNSTDGTPTSYSWSTGESANRIYAYWSDYYSVTVTFSNGCSATETFFVEPPSGSNCIYYLKEDPTPKILNTSLFPNPVDDELIVELADDIISAYNKPIPVTLFDGMGRTAIVANIVNGEKRIILNTKDLTAGIYLIQIGSEKVGIVRKKVLVAH